MASFDTINYSLRPNKAIQRAIAFECVSRSIHACDIGPLVYVGLGSIWFGDFHSAHKSLNIKKLVSIEADEIGYKRALFNKPFKCVDIREGLTTEVLPLLSEDKSYSKQPWFCWLDYDYDANEAVVEDLSLAPEALPSSSIFLITVNSHPQRYGNRPKRIERLKSLFGDVVPDDIGRDEIENAAFSETLGKLLHSYILSRSISSGRPGKYVPICTLPYKDGAPMLTIGGVFAKPGMTATLGEMLDDKEWPGFPNIQISTPPLTIKESVTLQAQLPRSRPLTRASLRRLGFDLADEQIASFEKFYRYYPHFAQITG